MHGRRDWTRDSLAEGVRTGDRRALARAISLIENGDPLAYDLVHDIYPETGRTYAVGITGPPDRRAFGGSIEPLHAGRVARRPDPALRPFPRPRRVHPLDGHARPSRGPGRDVAAGAARARCRGQRARLPGDRRRGSERSGGDWD